MGMEKEGWNLVDKKVDILERKRVKGTLDVNISESLRNRLKRFSGNSEKAENIRLENLSGEIRAMIELRWKNLVDSFCKYRDIEDRIIVDEILLQQLIGEIMDKNRGVISTRCPETDRIVDEIKEFIQAEKDLKESSPEAYIYLNLSDFKENIKRVRRGSLAETSSVKLVKEDILEKMKLGKHFFIHGHLGGGKSDLAIDVSIERMIDLHVGREIGEWMDNNPQASEKEIAREYRKIKNKYEKGVKEGDSEIMDKVRPYVISGSKDFSLQDLYVEKTLTLVKFNGKTLSEHNKIVEDECKKWEKENAESLSRLNVDQRRERIMDERKRILDLYIMKNQGFGTEVRKITKELKKAIEEGKTIIIDEANAIPPTLLISMNDILSKGYKKNAYIPGEGPVEIKEGFNVIMTGNLRGSSIADYFGIEEMNPAFLSRLEKISYDYLYQNKAGNVYEQEKPEENELFQVILTFLAEKDGSLILPQGSLEKLFQLAQLAKVTQDVFSGRWEESDFSPTASGDRAIEPRLDKSVLSIRNIINVLQEWNKGQKNDLDMALWKSFISGATVPSDQDYILSQAANRFGFFSQERGWREIKPLGVNAPLRTLDDIRTKKYEYNRLENHCFSPREVVEILYGKAPERINFPDIDLDAFKEREIDIKRIAEIEEFERGDLKKYEKAYNIANSKEGCPPLNR